MTDTARIHSIQYLRGIAALAVALAHITDLQYILAPLEKPVVPRFTGYWGVDIFFVISGFIIVYITREVNIGYKSSREFILKRFIRIIPAYWFFTLLVYFINAQGWLDDKTSAADTALLFKSLFFIKQGFPLLNVGWTLTLEMFFYMVFSVGLLVASHYRRILMVSLFFIVLVVIRFLHNGKHFNFMFYTQPVILEFVAGMFLGGFYQKIRLWIGEAYGLGIFIVGVAILLFVTMALPNETLIALRVLWWGVPATLIVAGVLCTRVIECFVWLRSMGTVSYSIYLSHLPCAYLSFVITKKYFYFLDTPLWAYLFMAIGLTALVSVLSWQLL